MLIETAILEDDLAQCALLQEYLADYPNDAYSFKLSIYHCAEDFLAEFTPGSFHLLLVDIQLPRMDGLSAARRARALDDDVVIVFITSAPQFAINGYEVNAKDYILKPLIYDSFMRKMERTLRYVSERKSQLVALNASGVQTDVIPANDIIYVEVYGHKVVYHCKDGDLESYGKLSDAEELLAPYHFLRCNRSSVVNPKHIDRIQGNVIKMGEYTLIISSPRKKAFMKALNEWINR